MSESDTPATFPDNDTQPPTATTDSTLAEEPQKERAERVLITDGHVRSKPDIQTHVDEHGRTVVDSETHFVPVPLFMAYDPESGLVYGGTSEAAALGTEDEGGE